MVNLSGKTAFVTGASRGIGRASALALAQAGAQVLVHLWPRQDRSRRRRDSQRTRRVPARVHLEVSPLRGRAGRRDSVVFGAKVDRRYGKKLSALCARRTT